MSLDQQIDTVATDGIVLTEAAAGKVELRRAIRAAQVPSRVISSATTPARAAASASPTSARAARMARPLPIAPDSAIGPSNHCLVSATKAKAT